jgi:hypothetical protein
MTEQDSADANAAEYEPVVEDAAGWLVARIEGRIPRAADYCPISLWLMHKRTDRLCVTPKPCESWWCERGCARSKATRLLEEAAGQFRKYERVWFSRGSSDPLIHERVRQRRNRRQAQSLIVSRSDGTFHVFATQELGGRKAPEVGRWGTANEAIEVLRTDAAVIPGVVAVSWSKGWQDQRDLVREEAANEYARVGVAPREWVRRVEEAVAVRCRAEYGIDPSDGFGRPGNVNESTWLDMHQEELQRIRDEHRDARDRVSREGLGDAAAVSATQLDADDASNIQDVTLAPWNAPPNVTLPPLVQDLCGKRDIPTWGNRDNAEADPSCGNAQLSAELLNDFASGVEEVVDGEGLADDIERVPEVDEDTGER